MSRSDVEVSGDAGRAVERPTDRAKLWEKFTAGEKLAYGCGYRDARASRIDVDRLARAIEDHGDICSRMAIPECAERIAETYATPEPVTTAQPE